MKNYFKVIIGAIAIGGIMAFFFYKDIKNEVIAITKDQEIAYVFQIGVFKNYENALSFSNNYPSSGIYQEDDLYRIFIAITIDNKEKLENYFQEKGINYYIKEMMIEEDLREKIKNYDQVLSKTNKEEVINTLNKDAITLFLNN